ncbi:hypothetical protein JVU11DRAFT_2169 [Chiua virens]|nr:hypothetical protein JVU11DRAFT_2169 [Chiua virens]
MTSIQARFQAPYMQCGCPVPDETSVHKLVRFVRHYIRGRSQLQIDLHPEHLPATHPSTHNALLTFQTVSTGTSMFDKFLRSHGKRKEEKLRRSPSLPHPTRMLGFNLKRTASTRTQLKPDWLPPIPSPTLPVYFEKGMSLVANPSRS